MSTMEDTKLDQAAIVGMDLSAYLVDDPARAIAFYRDVLGLVPTAVDDEGRGAEFTLADGQTFGVWKADGGPSSGGAVMFAVGDVHAAVARIRANGGTIADPIESPVCHMAFGNDPAGNGYIIHQRKA
jgi:predicted enzyme related to lactoylglutathione lyase